MTAGKSRSSHRSTYSVKFSPETDQALLQTIDQVLSEAGQSGFSDLCKRALQLMLTEQSAAVSADSSASDLPQSNLPQPDLDPAAAPTNLDPPSPQPTAPDAPSIAPDAAPVGPTALPMVMLLEQQVMLLQLQVMQMEQRLREVASSTQVTDLTSQLQQLNDRLTQLEQPRLDPPDPPLIEDLLEEPLEEPPSDPLLTRLAPLLEDF